MSTTVVRKYGGTSVGSVEKIRALAALLAQHHRSGHLRTAVVVSAMAGETNRLVGLMKELNPLSSTAAYDMTVSAGEQISVGLLAGALEREGMKALPLLGHQLGIRTDGAHGRARITAIDTQLIRNAWENGAIPVVAGFQGVGADNAITTLGRGGSDTSAVALAVALGADECEINTDVDGVYTADPRIIPQARHVARMDYETALEMAALGSKVLHPRCVELGAKYRMPIVVRDSFSAPNARSTKIMEFSAQEALESPVVTGVTLLKDAARVSIQGFEPKAPLLGDLFERIAAKGINVDVIVHNRRPDGELQAVGFTVPAEDLPATLSAIETLSALPPYRGLAVSTQKALAKVSAVGVGMRSHSGVASRFFAALRKAGVDPVMVTTSEIKISAVVEESGGEAAARAIHAEFFRE